MRIICACLSLFVLLTGCSSSTTVESGDDSSETKDIKKVITAFDSWVVEKDAKVLKTLFTQETEAIVYNASSEVWKGAATIPKKMQRGSDKIDDASVDIRDQDIKVVGNVAWFSERGDFKFDYDGQRLTQDGIRMTGVLLKEDGKWKIVQWHTSFPSRQPKEKEQEQQDQ